MFRRSKCLTKKKIVKFQEISNLLNTDGYCNRSYSNQLYCLYNKSLKNFNFEKIIFTEDYRKIFQLLLKTIDNSTIRNKLLNNILYLCNEDEKEKKENLQIALQTILYIILHKKNKKIIKDLLEINKMKDTNIFESIMPEDEISQFITKETAYKHENIDFDYSFYMFILKKIKLVNDISQMKNYILTVSKLKLLTEKFETNQIDEIPFNLDDLNIDIDKLKMKNIERKKENKIKENKINLNELKMSESESKKEDELVVKKHDPKETETDIIVKDFISEIKQDKIDNLDMCKKKYNFLKNQIKFPIPFIEYEKLKNYFNMYNIYFMSLPNPTETQILYHSNLIEWLENREEYKREIALDKQKIIESLEPEIEDAMKLMRTYIPVDIKRFVLSSDKDKWKTYNLFKTEYPMFSERLTQHILDSPLYILRKSNTFVFKLHPSEINRFQINKLDYIELLALYGRVKDIKDNKFEDFKESLFKRIDFFRKSNRNRLYIYNKMPIGPFSENEEYPVSPVKDTQIEQKEEEEDKKKDEEIEIPKYKELLNKNKLTKKKAEKREKKIEEEKSQLDLRSTKSNFLEMIKKGDKTLKNKISAKPNIDLLSQIRERSNKETNI